MIIKKTKAMKFKDGIRVAAFCTVFMLVLLLNSAQSAGQTAGGSVVLAKCNSWVSFTVNKSSADVIIKNISNRTNEKARVEITIGSVKTIELIDYGGEIPKGGFTGTTYFKVNNTEKGKSGTTCGGKGPVDGDVRVTIPGNATNIKTGNIVTGSTCSVCGANFDPIIQ
jgi:hypothetical protein